MARRKGREGGAGESLPARYEGPEVLRDLLARAGSALSPEEVVERFRRAQAAGEERSDVIPTLFADEPRFGAPEDARRLYANLFGLWSRVKHGQSLTADPEPVDGTPGGSPAPDLAAPPPLPARGAASGRELAADLVEAVWKHLDALPEREQRRLRHRFEGAQPDLVAWLDAAPLGDAGAIAAQDLAFETWAMFDVAFGDRLEPVPFADLRALAEEPPVLETTQPALAAYVAEVLDLLAEEEPAFDAAARAQVERVMATVATALGDALEEEEEP